MAQVPLVRNFRTQSQSERTLCLMDAAPVQRVALKARTNIPEDYAFVSSIRNRSEHALILTDTEDISVASSALSLIRRVTSNISRDFNNRTHFMETFIPHFIDTELNSRRQNKEGLAAQVTAEHKQALQKDIMQSLLLLEPIIPEDGRFLLRVIGSSYDDDYAYEWHVDGDGETERAVRCVDDRSTLIAYDDCSYDTAASMCVTAGQGLYVIRGDAWHATPGFKGERSCYTLDLLRP